MKRAKIFGLMFLFWASVAVTASGQSMFDITTPFKLWLLNNEARALSSLSFDGQIIKQLSTPFSIMPSTVGAEAEAVEGLWELHRKYYIFLDEIQSIYTKLKRFESGKLAVLVKRARPELWCLAGFENFEVLINTGLHLNVRDIWHSALMDSLGLTEQDKDLNRQLLRSINKISSGELRLLEQYFAAFSALYPTNDKIKILSAFVTQGSRSQPGLGVYVKDILQLKDVIQAEFDAHGESGIDSLLELEKIMSDGEGSGSAQAADNQWFDEEPVQGDDAFDIW
jgi:hypothetical protein